MSLRRELDRFKQVVKRREERQGGLLIATVIDTGPHSGYGYIVARLVDGTVINVRAWTPVQLAVGQQIIVAPMGGQTWNWYALIQVNASSNVETTPYIPPSLSTSVLPQHGLDSLAHSGTLPWSRVDTTASKVDLATQVSGILPVTSQAKQTSVQTVTITTGSLNAGATGNGSVTGPKLAYIRKVEVAGPAPLTLIFRESPSGTVEYQTSTVTPPFLDQGGWIHLEASQASQIHWEVTNQGSSAASFTITLQCIAWEV
jgi:hypothetical protein